MSIVSVKFAETSESASLPAGQAGGIGAFNINLKSFLFQLATFVIVLLVLRKWVFPKLVATLESRRQTLEESLVKAKQTEEALAKAEVRAGQIIRQARDQADKTVAEAAAQAKDIVAKAEAAAEAGAQRLAAEAEERLAQERLKLHEALRDELADLVADTTERVLRRKLDEREDSRLIEEAMREVRV